MRDKSQIDLTKLSRETDASLRSLWVDGMQLLVRADGVSMLQFFAFSPPDKMAEVGRFHTPTAHLVQIIDVLCRTLDYYPTKPTSPNDHKVS